MAETGRLIRPVFIAGSPRSGTTLVQNLLGRDPDVFRLGRESRFLWHRLGGQEVTGRFPGRARVEEAYLAEVFRGDRAWTREEQRRWALRCASQGMPAQYLDLPHDLLAEVAGSVPVGPFAGTEQTETAPFTLPPIGATFAGDTAGEVRLVDKDTGHCWRLPELADAFPDARFLLVVRDPLDAARSLVAGWRHPTWFFTYRLSDDLRIRGYSDEFAWGRHWWNFNLFPGHEDLHDQPVEEVCAQQWAAAMRPLIEHGLPLVAQGRAMFVGYERLVADPVTELAALARFTGLDPATVVGGGLDRTYMSMVPDTWDPGDESRLRAAVNRVRPVLDPIAHLLAR